MCQPIKLQRVSSGARLFFLPLGGIKSDSRETGSDHFLPSFLFGSRRPRVLVCVSLSSKFMNLQKICVSIAFHFPATESPETWNIETGPQEAGVCSIDCQNTPGFLPSLTTHHSFQPHSENSSSFRLLFGPQMNQTFLLVNAIQIDLVRT